MKTLWRTQLFTRAKLGNADSEFEDSAAWNDELGRFAIADGATETSFARSWADLLTRSWVDGRAPLRLARSGHRWLDGLSHAWKESLPTSPLSWYAQAKALQGAAAALCGLQLAPVNDHGQGNWHAVAIGDSCLFHLRRVKEGLTLLRAFPICDSRAFGRSPFLLSTERHGIDVMQREVRVGRGGYRHGDAFLLATDALAQTMLFANEQGASLWHEALALDYGDSFDGWIDDLRRERRLRNDDVTALVVRCLPYVDHPAPCDSGESS